MVIAVGAVTKAWLLYLGLLFVLMVLYAPGGLASLIMANVQMAKFGQFRRLVRPYAWSAAAALVVIAPSRPWRHARAERSQRWAFLGRRGAWKRARGLGHAITRSERPPSASGRSSIRSARPDSTRVRVLVETTRSVPAGSSAGSTRLRYSQTQVQASGQLGLLGCAGTYLSQILVHQIFKHGGATLEPGRRYIGQVVGNDVQLGLLGFHAGFCDPQ